MFLPAWVEVDLEVLRGNFRRIFQDKPRGVAVLSVVKDRGYGHGAIAVAREAVRAGVCYLAVATVGEALELRDAGLEAPILVFGERNEQEIDTCLRHRLTVFVNDLRTLGEVRKAVRRIGTRAKVHVEVDTGLSRYGVRWTDALEVIREVASCPEVELEGVMSHFAQSDELDKSFALEQLRRFQSVLDAMGREGIRVRYRHMCNSGGFLDLPQAHFDLVRLGILPLGVYPSQVCRRIEGIRPVMSVRARIAALRDLEPGDVVGYGMHYRAASHRRIAIVPIGYADGFPRVRNRGHMLVRGKKAPIVGGNAMDATMIDVTEIEGVSRWDVVTILGRDGEEEITAHEIASWRGTVSYDILAGWGPRLARVYLDAQGPDTQVLC
ncbi:MAG: alanine racemase [candidate division KSB1 bacterium]|nr:alanine racemase [candidate division KSB1 bacterium]